jgi:hypothetical protein
LAGLAATMASVLLAVTVVLGGRFLGFSVVAMTVLAMVVRLCGWPVFIELGLHIGTAGNEHVREDAFGQNNHSDEDSDKNRFNHLGNPATGNSGVAIRVIEREVSPQT